MIVSWIWQAGGVASRATPAGRARRRQGPEGPRRQPRDGHDAEGRRRRVISLPSNEIYAAMQTGAMDAAMTSSTSLISFRLEEIAKDLTTGRDKAASGSCSSRC